MFNFYSKKNSDKQITIFLLFNPTLLIVKYNIWNTWPVYIFVTTLIENKIWFYKLLTNFKQIYYLCKTNKIYAFYKWNIG